MTEKGLIHAEGTMLADGAGRPFQIRSVNLGNWFVLECYMAVTDAGDFETGVYTTQRALLAMKQPPRLSGKEIEDLYHLY